MDTFNLHEISIILVMIGTCFMVISIYTSLQINKVVSQEIRQKWAIITSLMIAFLIGYSIFLFLQFPDIVDYFEIIGAIVFLGGALFVFLVMLIIQNTLTLMNKTSRTLENKVYEHKQVSEELRHSRATLESIFDNAIPLCITDNNYEILQANDAYYNIFGHSGEDPSRHKCYESRPGKSCHTEKCPLDRIIQGEKEVICDTLKEGDKGLKKHFIITARPFLNANKETIGIVESFQDISDRKRAEEAKEDLIAELQNSLEEVNLLSGFLPICASCKKIRDDKGYWNQLEEYISERSSAQFSHGICPNCAKKIYPEQYEKLYPEKK